MLRTFQNVSFQIRNAQSVFRDRMHLVVPADFMVSVTGVEKCLATSGHVSEGVSRED